MRKGERGGEEGIKEKRGVLELGGWEGVGLWKGLVGRRMQKKCSGKSREENCYWTGYLNLQNIVQIESLIRMREALNTAFTIKNAHLQYSGASG